MAGTAVLDVNNVEVVYNRTVQVLRGLSLRVPQGQIVALLGSNGAGKSTLLKAVSNLLALEDGAVTGGAIHFQGDDIGSLAPHGLVRRGLFHVMEGRRIFEDLTVEENLTAATFALTGRKLPAADFDLVRLADDPGEHPPHAPAGVVVQLGRAFLEIDHRRHAGLVALADRQHAISNVDGVAGQKPAVYNLIGKKLQVL